MSMVKIKLRGVLPPPDDRRVLPANFHLLSPRGEKLYLSAANTKTTIESTIEGASTLTIVVRDYGHRLMRSPPVRQRSTVILDAVSYTLVKVSHTTDELTLIFEETAVNVLRRYSKPRVAKRDVCTRAQFIRGMVLEPFEAIIPLRCPELNDRQPIAKGS